MKLLRAWLALITSAALVSGVALAQYVRVQDEATNVTRRSTLNFTGSGVTCVDTPGTYTTACTFTGTSFDGGWFPADPPNCAPGHYMVGIDDNGGATCAAIPTCEGAEVLTFTGGAFSCEVPTNDAGTTLMRADTRQRRRTVHCPLASWNGTFNTCDQGVSPSFGCAGSCTSGNDSEQPWILGTTGAGVGTSAGITSSTINTQAWYEPRLVAHVKTDTTIDSRRFWVQWTNNSTSYSSPIPDSGTLPNAYIFGGAGFNLWSSQSWMCCASDGDHVTCNTTGLIVQPSTAYQVEINYTAAGTDCVVTTLDGGYGHAAVTAYPFADSKTLGPLMYLTNLDGGAARSMKFGYYEYEAE